MEEFFTKYPLVKKYLLPLIIGFVGFVLILIGIFISFGQQPEEKISLEKDQSVETGLKPVSTGNQKQIVVDVEGAVIRQGIYSLNIDSRVQDALHAAGGLSENADREFVEKKINLAAKLVDGGKIYIPHAGESAANSVSADSPISMSDASRTININEATAVQLDSLPGVGEVTAQKIIAGRPYATLTDLVTKKIVSNSVFTKIKDKISTD